jgi:hypothetical protein
MLKWKVNGSSSGSYPVTGFDNIGFTTLDFVTAVLFLR